MLKSNRLKLKEYVLFIIFIYLRSDNLLYKSRCAHPEFNPHQKANTIFAHFNTSPPQTRLEYHYHAFDSTFPSLHIYPTVDTCNGSSEESDQVQTNPLDKKDMELNPFNCSFAVAPPTFCGCPIQSVASMHPPLFVLGTARVRQ